AQKGKNKLAEAVAAAQEKKDAPEKTHAFEMRAQPWSKVFEWLTDATGRPFISPSLPKGTFNFVPPNDRKYTIPEIIDIINDGLIANKWLLIDRGRSYALIPADEKLDPALLARIPLEELPKHGKTEIVSTMYQCRSLSAIL